MKARLLPLFIYLLIGIRWLKNILITLLIIAFLTQFINQVEVIPLLNKINVTVTQAGQPILSIIKKTIPYRYGGIDFSKLFLAIFLQAIGYLVFLAEKQLQKNLRTFKRIKSQQAYQHMITTNTIMPSQESNQTKTNEANAIDLENLSLQKPGDRKKLLKQFASLKSKLDSMGQQLAFLSIDVVDSTGMKQNEDKHIISFAFDRYNEIALESLYEYGVVKYATTPDGIMSCFRTVDDAVNAALSLFKKLKKFNEEEKIIKRSFQIRCGINAGYVYLDDSIPLEQVSDRVIDIAGHMQKYAKPNSINIAAQAIEPLKNHQGFSETTDVIDEQKVYQWSSKQFE